MTSELSIKDTFKSMNYYDEQAVFNAFGCDATALEHRPTVFLRAMAFVDLRRKSETHEAAWAQAREMTVDALTGYFPDDPIDIDPDSPETPEGKELSPSE